MSLDRDELALRAALDRRRPMSLPPELLRRLEGITTEVPQLRPLPVRIAIGVAPWLAIAAAAVVVAVAPLLAAPHLSAGDAQFVWTAANPGDSFADVGIFGFPWVVLVVVLALVGAVATGWNVLHGRRAFDWLRLRRRKGERARPRDLLVTCGAVFAMFWVFQAFSAAAGHGSPWQDGVSYGSRNAPGPEVSEVRPGGAWMDEMVDETYADTSAVPFWVYRLMPGDPFTVIASARNATALPMTILGLPRRDNTPRAFGWTGLGLLRDPATMSTAPGDVQAFTPVTLAPGEEVTLVLAGVAGRCADPAAVVPPSTTSDSSGTTVTMGPGFTLVYEVFGWRMTGTAFPPFHLVVPTTAGCE